MREETSLLDNFHIEARAVREEYMSYFNNEVAVTVARQWGLRVTE